MPQKDSGYFGARALRMRIDINANASFTLGKARLSHYSHRDHVERELNRNKDS